MVKVYPIDQRFRIQVDSVSFVVVPLRYSQKSEISSKTITVKDGGKVIQDQSLSHFLTLKFSIKEVEGISNPDESTWIPTFDPDGNLSDDSVEALLNSELGYVLGFYALQAVDSTPHQLVNPLTKTPLKNVTFQAIEDSKKKS